MVKRLKLTEGKTLFWAVAFLLFFIPVYPKFPLFAVPDTYVHVRLEDIFVAITVGIFGLRLLLRRDFSIFKWPVTRAVMVFVGIGVLANISGILITKNIVPHLSFLHLLRRVEYLSLLFVAYYSIKNLKQLKTLGWVIFIATVLIIAYGLGQKFFGWPVVSTMNKEFSKGMILRLTWWARVNSSFAGHYDLAAYMVMILSLILAALGIIKKKLVWLLVFILGLFSYYILILTASRVSFGAYLIGGLFVLVMSKRKWWIMPFLILSLLGMVFSDDLGQRYAATFKIDLSFMSGLVKVEPPKIAIAPTLTPIPTVVPTSGPPPKVVPVKIVPTNTPTPTPTIPEASPSAYFEPTALAVGRSTDIRLKVEWPRALRAFAKNPLLGTGYSSITLATDNDYLRMLGESGLLGSLAFLAIVLEMVRKVYVYLRSKTASKEGRLIVIGISGAAVGYFLNATFIDVFEASKIAFFFWILMGIALKIIDLEDKAVDNNGQPG